MIEQPQLQRDPGHREYLQAASVGMTVEQFRQMKEDKEYRDEVKAIDDEDRADAEADAGADETASNDAGIGARANWGHGELMGAAENQPIAQDDFSPQSEEQAKTENTWRGYVEPPADQEMAGLYEDPEPMGMLDDLRAETQAGEFEDAQGGFMPPEAAAGEQADIQRDENDPVVKEAKELQKKAAEGDPEAQKAQEEMYDGLSKEEKAMAKEELGNYYIGPGGYAINLETVDADNQRGANFLMLQHVPVHARAQMLANWGYIDQEDVDNLPDSPTVQKAKIEAETELAKQNLISETDLTKVDKTVAGTLNVTNAQIKAQKELNTSNNTLKRELALKDDEFRRLDLEDKNWRFMERQELEAYMHNNGIDLDEKKLAALQDHQLAQINLGYSKIRSVERVEANMLKFKDKQWSQKYTLATDQEKRAMLLQEHTKGMDVINMAMEHGQLDLAAVTALKMGVPFIPDYKAYATAHARASNTDPNVKAVLDKHFHDMKPSVVAGQYATYKNGRMKFYGSAPKEAGMLSNLDNWIAADATRGKIWDDMTASEKEEYNSKEHWRAKKIIEATNSDLRNSTYNQYHTAITNRTMPDIDPSGKDTGGTTTTTTTNANANKETIIDESPPPKITKESVAKKIMGTSKKAIESEIEGLLGYGREKKGRQGQSKTVKIPNKEAYARSIKTGKQEVSNMLNSSGRNRPNFIRNNSEAKLSDIINHYKENPDQFANKSAHFRYYIVKEARKKEIYFNEKGNKRG